MVGFEKVGKRRAPFAVQCKSENTYNIVASGKLGFLIPLGLSTTILLRQDPCSQSTCHIAGRYVTEDCY
jgi:hypothetical protein